jgi:hypothetical protein
MNETSGIVKSVGTLEREAFAEKFRLFEALLLALPVCESNVFLFGINQCTVGMYLINVILFCSKKSLPVWKMLVSTQVV